MKTVKNRIPKEMELSSETEEMRNPMLEPTRGDGKDRDKNLKPSTDEDVDAQRTESKDKFVRPTQLKIVATIPCYNEEHFIGEVVRKVKKYVDEVIVIDDGSCDGTSPVARAAGAKLVSHKHNEGAGAATRSCFEASRENSADIVITLDGDNQHAPQEIPMLLAPIIEGEADMVIGSRFIRSNQQTNIPRYRRFGINVISLLFNIGSKVKVSDAQSCFRAYSRRLLDALNITENGFGFSVQVLIQAREKGFRIKEVPISCLYHSEGSTINPVRHGLGVAFTVVKLRLGSLFRGLLGGSNT